MPLPIVAVAEAAPVIIQALKSIGSFISIKRSTQHLQLADALNLANATATPFQEMLKRELDQTTFSLVSTALVERSKIFAVQEHWWNDAHLPGFYLTVANDIQRLSTSPSSDADANRIQVSLAEIAGWIARGIPSDNKIEFFDKWNFYLNQTLYPILRELGKDELASTLNDQTSAFAATGNPSTSGSGNNDNSAGTGTGSGTKTNTGLFGTGKTNSTANQASVIPSQYIPYAVGLFIFVILIRALK